MARGTIIRIDHDRGIGVIRPDEGPEPLSFHHSAVVGRVFDQLRAGQQVEFDRRSEAHPPGRMSARNVRVTGQ